MRTWRNLLLAGLTALALAACSSGGGVQNCATLTGDRQLADNSRLAGPVPSQVLIEVQIVAVQDDNVDSIGIDFNQFAEIMQDNGGAAGGQAQVNDPVAVDGNVLGGPDGIHYLVPVGHQASSFLGSINLNFVNAFGDLKIFPQLTGNNPAQCVLFGAGTTQPTTNYPGLNNAGLPARSPGLIGDSLAWALLDRAQRDSFLQALASDTTNQILSAPSIVALDRQRAVIVVDDLQVTLGGLLPQFQNEIQKNTNNPLGVFTGPALDIKPFIEANGNVRIEVRVGTRAASYFRSVPFNVNGTAADHEIPVIETTRSYTEVIIPDGMTTVLGGLRRQGQTNIESGVPLLGDLPTIGNLFGSGRIGTDQMTLIIFVTPTLVTPAE